MRSDFTPVALAALFAFAIAGPIDTPHAEEHHGHKRGHAHRDLQKRRITLTSTVTVPAAVPTYQAPCMNHTVTVTQTVTVPGHDCGANYNPQQTPPGGGGGYIDTPEGEPYKPNAEGYPAGDPPVVTVTAGGLPNPYGTPGPNPDGGKPGPVPEGSPPKNNPAGPAYTPGPVPGPNPGSPGPNPGSGSPNPGSPGPNPGSGSPNPGSGNPNPGSGSPNPGNGSPDSENSGAVLTENGGPAPTGKGKKNSCKAKQSGGGGGSKNSGGGSGYEETNGSSGGSSGGGDGGDTINVNIILIQIIKPGDVKTVPGLPGQYVTIPPVTVTSTCTVPVGGAVTQLPHVINNNYTIINNNYTIINNNYTIISNKTVVLYDATVLNNGTVLGGKNETSRYPQSNGTTPYGKGNTYPVLPPVTNQTTLGIPLNRTKIDSGYPVLPPVTNQTTLGIPLNRTKIDSGYPVLPPDTNQTSLGLPKTEPKLDSGYPVDTNRTEVSLGKPGLVPTNDTTNAPPDVTPGKPSKDNSTNLYEAVPYPGPGPSSKPFDGGVLVDGVPVTTSTSSSSYSSATPSYTPGGKPKEKLDGYAYGPADGELVDGVPVTTSSTYTHSASGTPTPTPTPGPKPGGYKAADGELVDGVPVTTSSTYAHSASSTPTPTPTPKSGGYNANPYRG